VPYFAEGTPFRRLVLALTGIVAVGAIVVGVEDYRDSHKDLSETAGTSYTPAPATKEATPRKKRSTRANGPRTSPTPCLTGKEKWFCQLRAARYPIQPSPGTWTNPTTAIGQTSTAAEQIEVASGGPPGQETICACLGAIPRSRVGDEVWTGRQSRLRQRTGQQFPKASFPGSP
jgi:hypothetical protein